MTTVKLQITDRPEVSLSGILDEINGVDSSWRICCLEAVGDLGPDMSILDLESRIDESDSGLPIDWKTLVEIASKLEQAINLKLSGLNKAKAGQPSTRISIELIDSAIWEIESDESSVITRIRDRFGSF